MLSKLIGLLAGATLLVVCQLLPATAWAQNSVRLDGLKSCGAATGTQAPCAACCRPSRSAAMPPMRRSSEWARMKPDKPSSRCSTFSAVNRRLSAPDQGAAAFQCTSMTELQQLWGSDEPANPVRQFDRSFYSMLIDDLGQLSPVGLYLTWPRAMHTRGCNLFLHKVAFYLTNYHASIHVQNAGVGLIRDYYDDTVKALMESSNFEDLMYQAATNGAVALAYGHFASYVHPFTGEFFGNDDFAREYFQLLFGIEGTMEDPEYHEGVTIENNARLLTGMMLDTEPDRFDSIAQQDWLRTEIDFSDHVDEAGRQIYNRYGTYRFPRRSVKLPGDSAPGYLWRHRQ